MNPMHLISEAGHLLLLAAVTGWVGRRVWGTEHGGKVTASVGIVLGLGTMGMAPEWSPAFATRALFGDFGALSWIYLFHWLGHSLGGRSVLSVGEKRILASSAVLGACLIYPASFGVPGAPDFYRFGFGGLALPTASLVFAGILGWRGGTASALCIAFGLTLYGLELHESANLWDCLFDLPSVIVSLAILFRWGRTSLRRLRAGADGASLSGRLPPS